MDGFRLESFIEQCRAAADDPEPWTGVRDVLEQALRDPDGIARALPPTRAELLPLHIGDDVTIMKVVWAPGMTFPPHDHLTWACNGLYAGCEDNSLYQLDDGVLHPDGRLSIGEGEIGFLDADAIHAVRNPDTRRLSAAIHVYGGDFSRLQRSNWVGEPPARTPADIEVTKRMFAAANERMELG